MRHLLLLIPCLMMFSPAMADGAARQKLVAWQTLLDRDAAASFNEITRFMAENPHWPEQKRLRLNAELSLRDGSVPDEDIIAWFAGQPPVSGVGRLALAEALSRREGAAEIIPTLIREAWTGGDFEEAEERRLLNTYGRYLTQDDHINRASRLLWEEKIVPARRMLARLPHDRRRLMEARIALIENKRTAGAALGQVSASLMNDPGLLYDRMRYRARRDDDRGVREMLLAAPATVPYPEKWWRYREMQVREAIDEGNARLASRLLANHGQTEGKGLADAVWLRGWLQLEFLGQAKQALATFSDMYDGVRYPVSRARAAFWAARAAEKSGNAGAAADWYDKAARHPTTFYGQMALARHASALKLPSAPSPSSAAKQRFEGSDLAKAAREAAALGEHHIAARLVEHMVETAEGDEDAALATGLGHELGLPHLSVRAAKKALQRNMVLTENGYPAPPTPGGLEVERPLALAVMRQESEFDAFAKSPSGALGMMQLLPGTAREVARKTGLGYRRDQLFDPEYNMIVGSRYLSRLVDSYGGSYVMAIAAYNAGPGNVRRWTRQFGTPGNDPDSAIGWIERIPFAETRNYVQRVMENLQVYRHLEDDGHSLMLAKDLAR